jgi:hypothetical protein
METAAPSSLDREVHEPQDDLLEMKVAAHELARQIPKMPKPYTIGLFGEWGSGKTSFARLVHHYLIKDKLLLQAPIFVDFSAWALQTSDEVWRALLLRIAERLFPPDAERPAEEKAPTVASAAAPAAGNAPSPLAAGTAPAAESRKQSFARRLARLLSSDALVFAVPEPDQPAAPPKLATYRDVVDRLDQTSVDIRRGDSPGARLDPEKALLAGLGVAVAALGSLSPLVAGLRGLLGLEAPKPAELLQRESNEAIRDRIESIERLRAILKQLFAEQAGGRCVCVFIDDLDRCMPDTALDLLEAIRIFLIDTPCIFLVAADEQLISSALQLRFKDLDHARGRHGAEYLEKIIQLRIPVPPPSPAQSRRLIAAQFPRWLVAADIVVTALGTNPRRLKQYCAFLNYRYDVAVIQSGRPIPAVVTRLEKLIQMRSWDGGEECLAALEDLDRASLLALEQHCGAPDPRPPLPPVLTFDVARIDRVLATPALRRLIAEPPLLSTATAGERTIFYRLADLEFDAKTAVLKTRDAPTLRLLKAVEAQEGLTKEQVLLDDFSRLVGLRDLPAPTLKALGEIAASEAWTATMLALEAALDARGGAPPGDLAGAAKAIFQQAIAEVDRDSPYPAANAPAVTGVLRAKLIDEEPRLSSLLREEVIAFLHVLPKLPTADRLLAANVQPSLELRNRTVASRLIGTLLARRLKHSIEAGLELRLDVARHVYAVRRFAKLDALRHRWPKLERLLWTHRFRLLKLERDLLAAAPNPVEMVEEGGDALPHRDAELAAYFGLRPLFGEIYPEDHHLFLKAAAATSAQAVSTPPTPSPAPATDIAPQVQVVANPHRVLEVTIEDPPAGAAPDIGFNIIFTWGTGSDTNVVRLPIAELLALTGSPKRDGEEPPFAPVTRDIRVRLPPLREIGMRLFEALFGHLLPSHDLMHLFQGGGPFRLLLTIKSRHLPPLPWETLYMPSRRQHLVLSKSFSLVRYFPRLAPRPLAALSQQLRILAVFPQPANLPPLNLQGEEHSLRRTLAPVIERKLVQLDVLRAGDATMSNLQSRLRVFQPHLFHFVGHGAFVEGAGHGALMFESGNGGAHPMAAADLRDILADGDLQVVVLNACDTGVASPRDPISGVAGALALGGVPAVIATLQQVTDPQAVLFAREFYRAFVDGYSVEEALAEARKAMTIEGWDWSLYALFSGIRDLDFLRFAP